MKPPAIYSRCSSCNGPNDRSHKYCRDCFAAYMREWRKSHPYSDMTDEQKKKSTARAMARVYVVRGHLHPKPCAVCGTTELVERHHENYDKPLDVTWLCRGHHREVTNAA